MRSRVPAPRGLCWARVIENWDAHGTVDSSSCSILGVFTHLLHGAVALALGSPAAAWLAPSSPQESTERSQRLKAIQADLQQRMESQGGAYLKLPPTERDAASRRVSMEAELVRVLEGTYQVIEARAMVTRHKNELSFLCMFVLDRAHEGTAVRHTVELRPGTP